MMGMNNKQEDPGLVGRREQPSISSTLNTRVFRTNVISAAFSSYMYVEKSAKMMFVRKRRT